MKRTLLVFLLMAGITMSGSCVLADSSNPAYKVGYSAAALIDVLQKAWSEALKKKVEEIGGECIVIDSENRIQKQLADIEDLIVQGIDVLAINPVDESGIVAAVEAANKAGIPVVTLDRASAGGDVRCHVGFDNYLAGYMAGEYIAMLNGFQGKVLDLTGPPGMSVVRERSGGLKDALSKYPKVTIVASLTGEWETAGGMSVTEDVMTANPDLVGIWAHCDAMIVGAIRALGEIGKTEQVVTVGMGMYGGGPEAIEEGRLNASWELFPAYLGEVAGDAVVQILKGESVPARIGTPMVFANQDNISRWKETKFKEVIE